MASRRSCGRGSFRSQASALTGGVQSWLKVVVRPGADATRAPAASLAPPLGLQPSSVLRDLRSSCPGAHRRGLPGVGRPPHRHRARRRPARARVRLERGGNRDQFLGNLVTALDVVGPRSVLLCTLRADYYGHCAARSELADAAVSRKQYLMGPMTESGLRSAITRPAEVVGLEFQYGLVDTILADVAARAVPCLCWSTRCSRPGSAGAESADARRLPRVSGGRVLTARRSHLPAGRPSPGEEDAG